jgi:xylulokinase
MNLQAEKPIGSNGLIYLPYLLGGVAVVGSRARGAFIGLTVRHTRADLLRSVLEGVTMNLRLILEAFQSQGASIQAMRVIGVGTAAGFGTG